MVVSVNPEPKNEDFNDLLDKTLMNLSIESNNHQDEYLTLLGSKLEGKVFDIMLKSAIDTPFENSIELISGQKFPDIIANKFYGVEVKTTKQNHWKTTGNSILESTRVDGIEKIFILFGKMISPIEFKYRPYASCLSDVVVTHSPRYLVDMDLEEGHTIFDKINMPYDTLRKDSDPIGQIVNYYRSLLKDGEQVWWLDQDDEKSKSLIIRFWNSLSKEIRNDYVAKGMVYFPEVFSSDFNRFALWLFESESVICPNLRDQFTAGGQGEIVWSDKKHDQIPKMIVKLDEFIEMIIQTLQTTSPNELMEYWQVDKKVELNSFWISLVEHHTKLLNLNIDIKEYLFDKIENCN